MKTKEEIRKFILDTLLPYKEDHSLRGVKEGTNNCCYLTDDGKKCAVGKHMKKGPWQYSSLSVKTLLESYDGSKILTKKAASFNLSIYTWQSMQTYHDLLVRYPDVCNRSISRIEQELGISLPELYLNKQ